MLIEETRGRFGFHLTSDKDQPHPTGPFLQIYVKSSAMSRVADSAISPHLTTASEIDRFIDEAMSALEVVRIDSKSALAAATSRLPDRPGCGLRRDH
jgi:hypothetical protein